MPEYPEEWKSIKTALCHDWLTGMRGGERVLEILCRGFPKARIYTLFHNKDAVSRTINRHRITTSWLQKVPGITDHYRYFLPAFPNAINSLSTYDARLMISTSHCVAKSILAQEGCKHLCYCFTPMRYAWLFQDEYFGKNALKRAAIKPMMAHLRRFDRRSSDRVDRYVAISHHVRKRIHDFYGRRADVVYPPADTDYFTPSGSDPDDYDLVVSALVPYKKVELAIAAYNESGRRLKLVGSGTEFDKLKALAASNIEFTGRVNDKQLREAYRHARMLIFPGEEDFGIVPVEAMACGRPVVAFNKGGATETVASGQSGVFFEEQTVASLNEAVERCGAMTWSPETVRARANEFSVQAFIDGMNSSIHACLSSSGGR